MQVEVNVTPTHDGKFLAVARHINPRLKSQGVLSKSWAFREAAVKRPSQEAAIAVAVLDVCLASLPESL